MKMAVHPEAYLETQSRLTTWTDELEFLGYILCELVDADGLSTRGYECHQAADLPTIVDVVQPQLQKPDGRLAQVMRKKELKALRQSIAQAKQIRNQMAHHATPDEQKLRDLESTKRSLCDLFERAIKSVALERETGQIPWSPCCHIYKTYTEQRQPLVVTVPLNDESLLSIRQRVLRDHDSIQEGLLHRRPKHKATEESRQKQKDDYEAAITRRRQKQERHMALQSHSLTEKLQKLEERFDRSQELSYTKLNVIKERMGAEKEIFHRMRTEILKRGVLQPAGDEPTLFMTILLAISSPLWIPCVLIYHLYSRSYV
ncbi:uncharacterized protein BO97DRAFT_377519 [Aspergillus homomorphus CBS 101889]|uniref:Uncharacterized protein n=1 Tax=Aspergillus homomorphus (strain CBS 101889) TaxID=1450537 RepID=A0A395HJ95_ASPHC|nr:hypothetical protein BO97DRAFT_377519 [Aspergillus homomorphus CBS 101889]RAL07897.1 hypothetical protein BO97DRAFT_377519 [Aspergillus homomorphus CBS 101889]